MKKLQTKLFLTGTIALTFNTLSAMIDAGDEAHIKAMVSTHAPSIKAQVQILKREYDGLKAAGAMTAAEKAAKDTIDDAGAADFKILLTEVTKKRLHALDPIANPATGNLDLYLDPAIEYLKGRIDAWIKAIIPAANDGTNFFHANVIGIPGGKAALLLATNTAAAIGAALPVNQQRSTFVAALNTILDNLKTSAVLKAVALVAAKPALVAAIDLPGNVSCKSIEAIRRAVIIAVNLTIQEYLNDIMDGTMGDNFLQGAIAGVPAGVITDRNMIPAGRTAQQFQTALANFLAKQ